MFRRVSISVAGVLAGLVSAASSAPFLYDGFDYPSGSLVGQAGGTWDATRPWAAGGSSNGSINATNVVTGLTFSDYPVVGGAAEVVQNNNNGNYEPYIAARQLPASLVIPSGSDLFVSFLTRLDQSSSFANQTQLSFAGAPFTGNQYFQSRIRTLFGADGPDNAAVGADNGVGTASAALIQQNTPYLVVSRLSNVNGPTFSSNVATMWVLEAADWDAIKSLSAITTADLDANNLLTATHAPGNTFVVTATPSNFLRLATVSNFGINNRSVFDEVRAGLSLSDVLTPIPEPASLPLLALGALALRRRRA